MPTNRNFPTNLDKAIADQHAWIDDHGRSRAGYIERYGSVNDPDHYGDGGEAIFAADIGELQRLIDERTRRLGL